MDGHAGGDPTSFTYTAAEAEQADFINMVTAMGLTHDTITFETANGWSPVNGDGDMFAGSGARIQEVRIPQPLQCQWKYGGQSR